MSEAEIAEYGKVLDRSMAFIGEGKPRRGSPLRSDITPVLARCGAGLAHTRRPGPVRGRPPPLLSNRCQPGLATGRRHPPNATQVIEITGQTMEPTSGLEPLTCSLRGSCGVLPPGCAGVRRRMPGRGLRGPGIPPASAVVR